MMFRRKLCPHCKTGKHTYEQDPHAPGCPYLYCHNGRKCAMYEAMDGAKKGSLFHHALERVLKRNRCLIGRR